MDSLWGELMLLMVELGNESIDSSLNPYACKSFRLCSLL